MAQLLCDVTLGDPRFMAELERCGHEQNVGIHWRNDSPRLPSLEASFNHVEYGWTCAEYIDKHRIATVGIDYSTTSEIVAGCVAPLFSIISKPAQETTPAPTGAAFPPNYITNEWSQVCDPPWSYTIDPNWSYTMNADGSRGTACTTKSSSQRIDVDTAIRAPGPTKRQNID